MQSIYYACLFINIFLLDIQEIAAQIHPTEYLNLVLRKDKTINFAYQKTAKIEWQKYEINITETDKEQLLHTIKPDTLFSLENLTEAIEKSKYENSLQITENCLHWLDVNADGKTDLIYNGSSFTASEGKHFVLWLNKNNKLTLTFALNASLHQIEYNLNTHFIDFQLIKTPCCAEYAFTYYQLCLACNQNYLDTKTGFSFIYNSYNTSNKLECMNLKIAYSFPTGILLPDKFTKSEIITLSKKTLLTIIPKKLPKKYNPFPKLPKQHSYIDASDFGLQTQIVISEFPKNSQAKILASEIDDTGNLFHFIAIENKQAKQSLFPKQSNFLVYGWISAEK